jgi:hypothetical protein
MRKMGTGQHHPLNPVVANLPRRSRTRLIPQSCNAVGDEMVAPQANRETRGAQFRCNGCVARSSGALQNDPRAKRGRAGTARLPRNTLQLSPLRWAHRQVMLRGTSTTRFHTPRRTHNLLLQFIYDPGDYGWAAAGCCSEAFCGGAGLGVGRGFGGSAFFPGARIACSVVPSIRGMNSTTPASPISWISRLMML